jgi:hypothetical protein
MALNTSKLRWPELGSDFKRNGMEIGTPSSGSSVNSRTYSISNCFSHAEPQAAENGFQAFAAWFNAPN